MIQWNQGNSIHVLTVHFLVSETEHRVSCIKFSLRSLDSNFGRKVPLPESGWRPWSKASCIWFATSKDIIPVQAPGKIDSWDPARSERARDSSKPSCLPSLVLWSLASHLHLTKFHSLQSTTVSRIPLFLPQMPTTFPPRRNPLPQTNFFRCCWSQRQLATGGHATVSCQNQGMDRAN
jgi:hypothetical protein